ncbi:thyrotroph embryonic factor isoform X5 [Brachionus plicatilis]|uniref:Thyrotroph embryonic factor isoform X5 n=1 Tax=Brachionus plicatilis TaxID=10195 RepID=A0A3M7S9T8_BRAPC|nr:thyrotroph embryonic factor isoform X5 [Brachionus plicatilis]
MFVNPSAKGKQNNSSEKETDDNRFPTDGLKTLLKNSELLEVLLKPLGKFDQINSENDLTDSSDIQLDLDLNLTGEANSKSLFEWDSHDYLSEMKTTKSSSDVDGAKCYGNAFLGQNLWDKNDLFQSEKFGVKFECLEMDEFLSENGLNETDVEFLDQIQKFDNLNSSLITETLNSNSSSTTINSTSSLSPNSSRISTSPSNNIHNNDQNNIISNLTTLNVVSSSDSKIANSQSNQITKGNQQNIQHQTINIKNKEDDGKKLDSYKSNFDWNLNLNDSTMDSISDYEFETKSKKFYDDDSKPQLVMRKSKKQFVPNELKDERYWARRRKNNMAAKRSRDARRMKENQIAVRASYLERENDNLRKQLEDFKRETKLLKAKLARYEADVQNENSLK